MKFLGLRPHVGTLSARHMRLLPAQLYERRVSVIKIGPFYICWRWKAPKGPYV